jgi:hypothetical protein
VPVGRIESTLARRRGSRSGYSITDIGAYALTDRCELSRLRSSTRSRHRVLEWLDRIAGRPATRAARARARRADPRTAFVPGVEPSRWG